MNEVIQILLGVVLALFVPGYLLTQLFFEEFKLLERLLMSVAFSMMIDIAIGILYGYNEQRAAVTGGLTFANIMKAEAIIVVVLSMAWLIKILVKNKLYKKGKVPSENESKRAQEK